MFYLKPPLVISMILLFSQASTGQDPRADAAKKLQVEQMKSLKFMDGVWRGSAWMMLPTGERKEITQTERIGSLLGGAVKVVEGRGYDSAGETVFNAMGVIAYDTQKKKLMMRSYAEGRIGDFEIKVRDDGYTWEIPAGPATIRYTAKFDADGFIEYGERIVGDNPPVKFFEMDLKRVSDSEWPAAGAVPPK